MHQQSRRCAVANSHFAQSDQVSALILDAPALDAQMVLGHITDELKLPLRSLGARLASPAFALTHGANLAQAAVIPVVLHYSTADALA